MEPTIREEPLALRSDHRDEKGTQVNLSIAEAEQALQTVHDTLLALIYDDVSGIPGIRETLAKQGLKLNIQIEASIEGTSLAGNRGLEVLGLSTSSPDVEDGLEKLRDMGICLDDLREAAQIEVRRNVEAEKAARSSVQTLETRDRPSLLAEALKRHGMALARLGHYSTALNAFRRAIDLSQDSFNRAADIALTAFQELGDRLAVKEAITTSGRPLNEEIFLLEHSLIKHALEDAHGRVTFAARTLGMSYQRLTHKLQTKHQDLLKDRSPLRHRKNHLPQKSTKST